jgi:hypothetical protein
MVPELNWLIIAECWEDYETRGCCYRIVQKLNKMRKNEQLTSTIVTSANKRRI